MSALREEDQARLIGRLEGYRPSLPATVLSCISHLLRTVPERWPLPQISANNDGEVALTWYAGSVRADVFADRDGCFAWLIFRRGDGTHQSGEMPLPEAWPDEVVAALDAILLPAATEPRP